MRPSTKTELQPKTTLLLYRLTYQKYNFWKLEVENKNELIHLKIFVHPNVRSNLDMHLSDTPFTIRQPIWRPHLLERVYKPICTPHWCAVLQSSIAESIRDRV